MAYYGRDYDRNRFDRSGSGYDAGFGRGAEGYSRWNQSENRGWDESDRDRFGYGGWGSGQQGADDRWQRPTQGWGRNFDDDWGTSQRFHEGPRYGNQAYGGQRFGRQGMGESGFGNRGYGSQDYGADYGPSVGGQGYSSQGYGGQGYSGRGYTGEGYGYGSRMGRSSFDRDRGYRGTDRERQMSDYDRDFGSTIRRGWNRLREEARDWMGRGYDRGW